MRMRKQEVKWVYEYDSQHTSYQTREQQVLTKNERIPQVLDLEAKKGTDDLYKYWEAQNKQSVCRHRIMIPNWVPQNQCHVEQWRRKDQCANHIEDEDELHAETTDSTEGDSQEV